MNHAKAPVEYGFDEPAPFARVPEMLLSDEPWRDSPWDIGAVEHGEAARPREGEPVIDKTANDAFIGTDLDRLLRCAGVRHLVVVGNTLDCCVHSTLRHANDLGLFQRRATGVFFRVNFA